MNLITVLVVFIAGGSTLAIEYDSREACSDALLRLSESSLYEDHPGTWARCEAYYAPTTPDVRPVARPWGGA